MPDLTTTELQAQITSLTQALDAAKAGIAEKDKSLAAMTGQFNDLSTRHKTLDAAHTDLTGKHTVLADTHGKLQTTVLASRRSGLTAKFGIPADKVANLDATAIDLLEATLPDVKPPAAKPTAPGFDIKGSSGNNAPAPQTDMERAQRILEKAGIK